MLTVLGFSGEDLSAIGMIIIVVVMGVLVMRDVRNNGENKRKRLETERPEGWQEQSVRMRYQTAVLIMVTGFITMGVIIGIGAIYKA